MIGWLIDLILAVIPYREQFKCNGYSIAMTQLAIYGHMLSSSWYFG